MLEAAYEEAVTSSHSLPTILTGDFNAPQEEGAEGLITWAQKRRKDKSWGLVRGRGERWDAAERNCFCGALTDAFRFVNGPVSAHSWVLRQRERRIPRRFDHVLVSDHWLVSQATYLVSALTENLSDHAPLLVTLQLAPSDRRIDRLEWKEGDIQRIR